MYGALFQNSFYIGNAFNGILYGKQESPAQGKDYP
jgi:hypothetical protein